MLFKIVKFININIQHGANIGEFKIPNTRYSADGYCLETNTIYEFNGTRWHGDPRFCNENDVSYFGVKYGELYEKTSKKENLIKNMGFNFVSIWEYDWDNINKNIKKIQKYYRESIKNKTSYPPQKYIYNKMKHFRASKSPQNRL